LPYFYFKGLLADLFLKKLERKLNFILLVSTKYAHDGLPEYVQRFWAQEAEGVFFVMNSDERKEEIYQVLRELGDDTPI
jgi:hypothetical protein